MNKYLILGFAISILMSFSSKLDGKDKVVRDRIELTGKWDFQLDSLNVGVNDNWAKTPFTDQVMLPGTTDTNQKGVLNSKMDETTHLSRVYTYVGKAWYKKQIEIPKQWNGTSISMVLERTKPTIVWIDGKEVGANDNISTSQTYDLTSFLKPGKHEITIMVDNGESVPPQLLSNSHAYTESTQTNWNGIIGDIYLESTSKFHIQDIQLYPNVEKKNVLVKLKLADVANIKQADIVIAASLWNSDLQYTLSPQKYKIDTSQKEVELEYSLGEDAPLWSEFHPALYRLDVTLEGQKVIYDKLSVDFGLRDFKAEGSHFTINGNKTFLRGKHDACVFPLTAHTAMDVDTWRHYFQVAKQYGINHYRFHSWCPPKACFEAADIEGIYLQPELPFWGTFDKKDQRLISYLSKEGVNIQNEYGGHASFVMFALGNEIFGYQEVMDSLISTFRGVDNDRHLYAFGANNYLGYNGQTPGEDFLVTCRIGGSPEKSFETHTRASFSFADAYDGGYLNHTYPNSSMTFTDAIAGKSTVPVVGHETGQYQIYPNYAEIEKYKGVLKPRNFEVFKQRLVDAGMLDQAKDFFEASGKLSTLLYRADIEMNLRTPNISGFQLLDLQDYPGQGSAFVGILDAFMDSKGLITLEEWQNFCSPVVPLLILDKFCWYNNEVLEAKIQIANYSEESLKGKELDWTLLDPKGLKIDGGVKIIDNSEQGLIDVANITTDLNNIQSPERISLTLSIKDTKYSNTYPLWVYPQQSVEVGDNSILITDKLDNSVRELLDKGGRVLWFPKAENYEKATVDGLFQTDYWNYRMFRTICENNNKPVSPGTLGILTNPKHPIFTSFPTEFHTNWQWFSIIKNSTPLIMDKIPADYKPIVQVIDNVERNHKLGLIFEFSVGKGKLLVCMADLAKVIDKPEVLQFYNSLVSYAKSDNFRPSYSISYSDLENLFKDSSTDKGIDLLQNISYQ